MLGYISPDVLRDDWMKVAFALYSHFGDDAFELFDRWSQGGRSYKASDARSAWKSAASPGDCKIGTLVRMAQSGGFSWQDVSASKRFGQAVVQGEGSDQRRRRDEAARKTVDEKHGEAAVRAEHIWNDALDAEHSPYLDRKMVRAFGVRVDASGTLIVPMRDEFGTLWNVQRIAPQRSEGATDKRFLSGGRKSGLMFWLGRPQEAGVLLLCEGYATGASLHEATGYPVCVAFDAGNLPAVAKAVRGNFRSALVVVCGDNDQLTKVKTGRNPGVEKAEQAAKASQGVAIWPDGLPDDQSDFNDLHRLKGLDAVRVRISEVVEKCSAAASKGRDETICSPQQEQEINSFDRFQVTDAGVFYLETDQDGRPKAPQWICSRLDVTARTRDEEGQGWGFLLNFNDPTGTPRTWAMPARMLASDGAEYRAHLLNMGLSIASGANARNRLTQYLQTRNPSEMVRCADRVGWHGRAFVLPRETIGDDGERVVYQVDGVSDNPYRQRGTVDTWRDKVGRVCVGNDRLLFAVSCALAGPLVRPGGVDSGGFHFRGASSCGKTTALRVAASVWGGTGYMHRWRATSNALESIAAQRCDGLLILDELAQVDPRDAGEAAYLLSNEQGKARSNRTGQARPCLTWRLLFLSAGEISLSQHMAEGGKRSKAGQELRLADIPADAGQGLGMFNQLHELASGAALSAHLAKATEAHHGTVGRDFLQWLADHVDDLRRLVHEGIERYTAEWVPEAASGQVQRVASRFAVVAVAGELATYAGLTGWPEGEAARGVRGCFNAWLAARGGIGDAEEGLMVRQVKRLLEERGAGNFAWFHRAADDRAPNPAERWGFRRLVDGCGKAIKTNSDHMKEFGEVMTPADGEETSVEYFVFPEVFRSRLCEGFDHVAVAKLLLKRGHLIPGPGDRYDRRERMPGIGNATVYRIKSTIFDDDGVGD